MLNKVFYKIDNDGRKKRMSDKEILILLAIIVMFVAMAIFIGFSASKVTENKDKKENTVSISDRFDLMKKNYTINIEKKENEKTLKLSITCDEDVCIYGSSVLPYDEIVGYKGKWYSVIDKTDLNKNNLIETNNKEVKANFNEIYYNMDLIKSAVEVSNRESIEDNVIKANISFERYLKEYNYIYSKTYKTDKDITIPVTLTLTSTKIETIEIDYKEIDKYFNNTDYEKLIYKIEIESINANDFSEVREFFKQ